MSTLILKKIRDKVRNDFPDEFIHNSEIKISTWNGIGFSLVPENIYQVFKDTDVGNQYEDENIYDSLTEIPKEIKKLLLETSSIYEEDEFDPLNEPCSNSFLYEDLVRNGEVLGDEKLNQFGLSKKKKHKTF